MDAPSRALQFFQELTAKSADEAFQFLSGFPTEKREETEWLEFKGAVEKDGKGGSKPLSDSALKRVFSEAICGFANTVGGVLILGIDAREMPNSKIDCAQSLELVDNPREWKARLDQLRISATEPPLQGIEILVVPGPAVKSSSRFPRLTVLVTIV